MNPIDQMMECYDVEKKERCIGVVSFFLCEDYDCCNCKRYQKTYPPFTAEKQIKLIKLIAMVSSIEIFTIKKYFVCSADYSYCFLGDQDKDFSIALATLVTKMKNKLDHRQVKEILEG